MPWQASLEAGLTLINRLAVIFGRRLGNGSAGGPTFPAPEDIARGELSSMRTLGFSHHKGLAIPDLATFLVREPAKLENLSTLDDQAAYEMLFGLCGVG